MQWILILKAVLESVHHADHFEYKVDCVKSSNKNFEFSLCVPPMCKLQVKCAGIGYQNCSLKFCTYQFFKDPHR